MSRRERKDSIPESCPKCGNGEAEWYRGPMYSDYYGELQYLCKLCGYEFSTKTVDQKKEP